MENLISPLIGLILVSLIVYIFKIILPSGNIRIITNIAYSALIMLLLLQMVSSISVTSNIFIFDRNLNLVSNIEYIKKGIEQQIKLSEGFANAQVVLTSDDDCVSAVRIIAYRSDNSDLLKFEKNKRVLTKKLQVMYGIDENEIIIEVI